MNRLHRYHLRVITGETTYTVAVEAAKFTTLTSNSSSSGYYCFRDADGCEVACYPISKTIIERIEKYI